MDVSPRNWTNFFFITYHLPLSLLYGHIFTPFVHHHLASIPVLTHAGPGDHNHVPSPSITYNTPTIGMYLSVNIVAPTG